LNDKLGLRVLPSSPSEVDFTWYELVRHELLTRVMGQAGRVLDVGCGNGRALIALSRLFGQGMGIDISEDALREAESARLSEGIGNIEFTRVDVLGLPFASESFDVVLCLGDVLCYSELYGRHADAVEQMKRVLKPGGLIVHESMNWEWEYRQCPSWTCFTRETGGAFCFHRTSRLPSGRETSRDHEVVPKTPLHDWVSRQDWPISPQGFDTSINVAEDTPLPREWLRPLGVRCYRHHTAASLRRLYAVAGFRNISVVPYGGACDMVELAGLAEELKPLQSRLAAAEADIACRLKSGSGPWLFLDARK